MKRCDFITLLSGAAAGTLSLPQPGRPVLGQT